MKKNCEFCKHAVSHYGSFYVSYVCDLFNEEVGICAIISDEDSECETTYYKCDKCIQAEVEKQ